MPASIVGALAVELGLDTAKFEQSLKGLPGVAGTHLNSMSAEMKRTSREGAESFRIVEEAIGIHISRPIAKILADEFPAFARGFQSLLGAGVALGVAAAAFEFIARGYERITKAIEDAKKKNEEFIQSQHQLAMTLNDEAIKTANALDTIKEKLADLSGDKEGALAARLRIISRTDADEAVAAIDAISDAYARNAKAAMEALSLWNRFWTFAGSLTTSPLDRATADVIKKNTELKNSYDEIASTQGLQKASDFVAGELQKQKTLLDAMKQNQLSGFDVGLAKLIPELDNYVAKHGAVTKETVRQQDALVASLRKQLEVTNQLIEIDKGRKHVAAAESAASPDPGEKELEKLKADTAAQLALASATAGSVAQQRLQQAAGEADQLISRILEEAHGRLTAKIREEMSAVHALTAERQVARDAIATNQDLQKALTAADQQIDSQKRLAQAYREGGDSVLAANVEAKLQPQIKAAADLREEYERLKQSAEDYADAIARLGDKWRIPMAPIPGIKGISSEALSVAKKNADEADARVEELRTKAIIEARQKYQTEIEQNDAAIQGEAPLLEALGAAYQQNAEAVRRAQVALALYHWEQAHPGADASQIEAVRVKLNQQSLEQRRNSDAELASRYSINFTYDETISKLQRAKEVMQEYGHDTLLIDAAIRDAQIEFLRQWDDAALKVGSFGEKFKAVMNEVVIQGKEASAKMAQAWLGAIDNVNSEMAKLLTGQQTDFKKIPQQLGEELTKAQLQKAEGAIAAHFGLKIPGLEGKPDGTDNNPLHVIIKNALPGSVPYGEGAPTSGGFGIGSFLSAIGFRAQGGPVMPGGDYIVGEQGPELLRIPHAGTIISNADMRSMSSVHRGGDTRSTHITQNFGPVTDGDMFKRTVRQENAKFFKHLK